MAEKYLIQGATFDGNGTTSAEAASAGAAGAWNTLAYLTDGTTPAFGTLAAGDTVHIRSKTGNGADANITVTLGASKTLGNASATNANPIYWRLDNGTTWSGINGTLTYNCPSTFVLTFRNYNVFKAETKHNWIIAETNAAASAKGYCTTQTFYHLDGIHFDFSGVTSSFGCYFTLPSGNATLNWSQCKVTTSRRSGTLFYGSFSTRYVFTGLELVLNTAAYGATEAMFRGGAGSGFEFYGGSISGAGAVSGVPVFSNFNGGSVAQGYGFQFPQAMSLYDGIVAPTELDAISMTGVDGNVGSSVIAHGGQLSSRSDAFYPVLSAQYPTATPVGWSWWLYPNTASFIKPLTLPSTKLYTAAAATKTLTLEMLVSTSYPGLDASNLYVVFTYVDNATGAAKSISTRNLARGALTASTAGWSATTYGAVNFNKRKFAATTPTSIKPDTLITATLVCEKAGTIAGDIMMLCPDFGVT